MSRGAGIYRSRRIAAQYTPYTQQLHGLSRLWLGSTTCRHPSAPGKAKGVQPALFLGLSCTSAPLFFLPPSANSTPPGRAAPPRKPPFSLNRKRCNLTGFDGLLELPQMLSSGRCKQNCIQNWAQICIQKWTQQLKTGHRTALRTGHSK